MTSTTEMAHKIIRSDVAIPKEYFIRDNKNLTRYNNGTKVTCCYYPGVDMSKYAEYVFAHSSVPEWNSLPVYPSITEFMEKFK